MLTDSYYLQGTLNKIQTYYCIEHPVKESFLNNWSAYLIKFESSCSLHYYIQTYFNTNLHYWWLNWQMAVKCTSNISSLSGTFVITDSIWWKHHELTDICQPITMQHSSAVFIGQSRPETAEALDQSQSTKDLVCDWPRDLNISLTTLVTSSEFILKTLILLIMKMNFPTFLLNLVHLFCKCKYNFVSLFYQI